MEKPNFYLSGADTETQPTREWPEPKVSIKDLVEELGDIDTESLDGNHGLYASKLQELCEPEEQQTP